MKKFIFLIAIFFAGCGSTRTTIEDEHISTTPPAIAGSDTATSMDMQNHFVPADQTSGIVDSGNIPDTTSTGNATDTGNLSVIKSRKKPTTFVEKAFPVWKAELQSPSGDSVHIKFDEFDHRFTWSMKGAAYTIAHPDTTRSDTSGVPWMVFIGVVVLFAIIFLAIGFLLGKGANIASKVAL